jgi:hypothetical protein
MRVLKPVAMRTPITELKQASRWRREPKDESEEE